MQLPESQAEAEAGEAGAAVAHLPSATSGVPTLMEAAMVLLLLLIRYVSAASAATSEHSKRVHTVCLMAPHFHL